MIARIPFQRMLDALRREDIGILRDAVSDAGHHAITGPGLLVTETEIDPLHFGPPSPDEIHPPRKPYGGRCGGNTAEGVGLTGGPKGEQGSKGVSTKNNIPLDECRNP